MTTETHRAEFVSPQELADMLGVPIGSVYRWRSRQEGPRGFRVGKHVRYRVRDIDLWLEQQADRPTS